MTNEQLVLKVKITPNIESRISDESCALGVKESGKMSVPTVPCTTYQTTDKEKGPSTAATVKSH